MKLQKLHLEKISTKQLEKLKFIYVLTFVTIFLQKKIVCSYVWQKICKALSKMEYKALFCLISWVLIGLNVYNYNNEVIYKKTLKENKQKKQT